MRGTSMCAAANRGPIYRPHLLRQVISPSGKVMYESPPEVLRVVNASPAVWDVLQKSLVDVVHAPHGTGYASRLETVKVAGKTATAQNPHGEDHAAFAAYAPAEAPTVAVVVYLENAGHGGSAAAPIARQVLEAYFGIASGKMVETQQDE